MPDLTRTPSHQQYQQHIPVSLGPAPMSYYQNPRQLSGFYGDLSAAGAGGMPMPSYDPYAVSAVPPLQMPTPGNAMGGPVGGPLPTQHRASSGAWNQDDDRTLLTLRAMGKNWNQIQRDAFPGKTGNACRKRHERLMERRGQNDFDNRKLERLCKEYMSMRKEIWSGLAARTGEKWNVVEQKCMSNGLKNLQSAARAASRRDRAEAGVSLSGYDDDSGISGMGLTPVDELDASYSSPETSPTGPHSASSASGYHHHLHPHAHHAHMQQAYAGAGHPGYAMASYGGNGYHGYSSSVSSSASHRYSPHGNSQSSSPYLQDQRQSSVDMGIEAIINRPRGV